MKINNEIAVLGLLFILSVFASNAMASSAVAVYDVHAAMADSQYFGGSSDHAIVFGGNDYVFAPGAGALIEYDDGSASLSGIAYNPLDTDQSYAINIILNGRTSIAPPDSPKRELLSSAYVENGGPVDTDSWYYYSSFSGTFEGMGELAGNVLQITQRGPAFQFGFGANNKNADFGGSGWFWAEDASGNRMHGDFNLGMRVVPVPAAIQLMISALAALGFATRRRKA